MEENQDFPLEKDQRRSRRVKGAVVEYSSVEYVFDKDKDSKKIAFLKDLSMGGLAMFVTEPIEVGSKLYLFVYLSDYKAPVLAKGEVVWRQASKYMENIEKKHYDVGIKFLEIDDENKTAISKYVEKYVR